jgi:translation initiation factor eIF-2B subunit delta
MRRLVKASIPCTYVLLNAVSNVMNGVTKVFVGAYAMMANGNLISRAGTALVAMTAKNYNKPFLVCCETYKFTDRVQLESFSFNELGK